MKLKWQQAPVKTQWGDEMVVASVAIDNDHTVCLYCEREQKSKVEAMFTQRTWVGLTDEEIDKGLLRSDYAFKTAEAWRAGVVFAMTKLKEKNT